MVTQKVGDEFDEGMKILRELYTKAKTDVREDVPLSELRVGLKCGGSDGFSGITANPVSYTHLSPGTLSWFYSGRKYL